jgi:hypothetical protein
LTAPSTQIVLVAVPKPLRNGMAVFCTEIIELAGLGRKVVAQRTDDSADSRLVLDLNRELETIKSAHSVVTRTPSAGSSFLQ